MVLQDDKIFGMGWCGESNHIYDPSGVEGLNSTLRDSIAGVLESVGWGRMYVAPVGA